jgi:DNA-binding NtrC family response regulator
MSAGRPVLIVDDDPDHAVIARMVVASVAPARAVETCMDPRGAATRLMQAPDSAVVLIDRVLGGAESIPLVRETVAARPDLYLVVLSSSLLPDAQARALAAGAREAVEKPGSLDGWRSLVSGVLTRAAAGDEPGREASLVG